MFCFFQNVGVVATISHGDGMLSSLLSLSGARFVVEPAKNGNAEIASFLFSVILAAVPIYSCVFTTIAK